MAEIEKAFSRQLQDSAMVIIAERDITRNELAEMLDIFPEGAHRLLSQNSWPAETGFKVLEALGATVEVTMKSPVNDK